MSPSVTVAIPIYNGARFLRSTIESLLAQMHRDLRLVCIDDQSTDDSLAVAESFHDERMRVVRNETRRGLAGNWNAALDAADSEYLLIAHQDDVYEPHYLATTMQVMEAHPNAFMAHTRATYIDENNHNVDSGALRFKDRFWPRQEPYERGDLDELRLLQKGNYIICPSALYRMSAVARIGRFDESYRFVTDWQYWMRGVLAGFTVAGTHARLVRWRRHDESATSKEAATLRRYDEEIAVLEWLAASASLPRRLGAAENTLLSDFAARLARGDREGAVAIRRYARVHLPDSRLAHAVMRLGTFGGPLAGHALRLAESIYTRFAPPFRSTFRSTRSAAPAR